MKDTFYSLDELYRAMETDKQDGLNASVSDRYAVRFILFPDFGSCREFVNHAAGHTTIMRLSDLTDATAPDVLPTYSRLSDTIMKKFGEKQGDLTVTPFSELARFYYDNTEYRDFDALVGTLKGIENTAKGRKMHRRIYLPVVGMLTKMERYEKDTQAFLWHLSLPDTPPAQKTLIMTCGSLYGVKGLDENYTVVNNVREWLDAWNNPEMKESILCASPALFSHASNAQPDNVFKFVTCRNARELLTNGLCLDLSFIPYNDDAFWKQLAGEINISHFSLNSFLAQRFGINSLSEDTFISAWTAQRDAFNRRLLCAAFLRSFPNSYAGQVLRTLTSYTDAALFDALELHIFSLPLNNAHQYLTARRNALCALSQTGASPSPEAQTELQNRLVRLFDGNPSEALQFITSASDVERQLLVMHACDNTINPESIKNIFPALYAYLRPSVNHIPVTDIDSYIDAYKRAKITNKYTEEIEQRINKLNASTTTFQNWYDQFKTTRTLLSSRSDIEAFYWIDGLGIDYIELVKWLLAARKSSGLYLNETHIAKAALPSVTQTNKAELLALAKDNLPKSGDLDAEAHKPRPYPQYILDDLRLVEQIFDRILKDNPGRKIAVVSDHGLSFLPQLRDGLHLKKLIADHGGRTASSADNVPHNSLFITLNNGNTVCALRHNSLTDKIPQGCGAHGGCTPEEALVPVFIISPNRTAQISWTAELLTPTISAAQSQLQFRITGLPDNVLPIIFYNNEKFTLKPDNTPGVFLSPSLHISPAANSVRLCIGDKEQTFSITINTGVQEEDIFNF